MTGVAAGLALVSALLYAVSSVAEQRAAFAVPDAQAGGLGLIRRTGTSRALLLAVATGIDYGITAALTKSVVSLLDDGLELIFTSWETYALVVSVIVGAVLLQSAFQAGGLGASLPAVTVLEPIVSVAIGIAVLEEHLDVTGATWFLIAGLVLVMVIATVALARSSVRRPPAKPPAVTVHT